MPSPPLSKKVAVVLQKSGTNDSKAQDEQDKESAAYLRRREQVRRAQRTHRERKENYIKALEDELFQVKARERKFAEENKALNAEVAQLRDLVTLDESQWCSTQWTGFNGVDPNAASECSMAISDGSDYMSLTTSSEWQIPSHMGGEYAMSSVSLESVAPTASTSPHSLDLAMVPAWRPATFNANQVNRTELAVEFVMTLEKPCLNRATSAILDIGQPHTDQPLSISGATSYHTYLEDSFLASNAGEEINPEQSLEKLRSLSSAFELTDELTPIQAWQQIVTHPGFGSLGLKRLTKLVEDMLEYIRCYGFGAVIERTTFDTLCRNLFAGKC